MVWKRLHVCLASQSCWRDARAPGKVTDGVPDSRHWAFRVMSMGEIGVSPEAGYVHLFSGSAMEDTRYRVIRRWRIARCTPNWKLGCFCRAT